MKIPFRLQVSEYDCVPTTLMNALSFLFKRSEIPPLVVQRIYLYCLDTVSPRGNIGHGTSGFATQFLAGWLGEYKHKTFNVSVEYLDGKAVHFKQGNKITQCLNRGGVAAMSVTYSERETHYVLALRAASGWIYCFDPYPPSKPRHSTDYEFMKPEKLHDPNLRIKVSWLKVKSMKQKFRLGIESERECLLFERHDG